MKNFQRFTFAAAVISAACIYPSVSEAEMRGWTPHYLVGNEEYTARMTGAQKLNLHRYLNYEHREPCQNYREVPGGFVREGCDLQHMHSRKVSTKVPVPEQTTHMEISNVLSTYEIHFAFDSAAVEPGAGPVLARIAQEISRYHPREVVIAGHADKSGSADYNVALSQRRAQAVSDVLTARGVPNRVIDEEAFGESDPAVDTQDGVALRENRRVVIQFRK